MCVCACACVHACVVVGQDESPRLWPRERLNRGHHDDQNCLGLMVSLWVPQKQTPR